MPAILIVDDEGNIRRMVASLLRAEGYAVREAGSGAAGVEAVREEEPDAMLLDLVMPGATGLEVLPALRSAAPHMPVVMMSGRATLSDAVRATQLGAFHFLEKPLAPEAVLMALRSALELRRAREVNRVLRSQLGVGGEMIGRSEAMRRVGELIERLAPTEARVLITGESGTGKELVAAAIHELSPRSGGPFVALNCAAIPRDLVESELFGHERGAFTGATERRRGRFELAHGGTFLLDEVGELSAEAQAKLLRVLETGELQRVGGSDAIRVDVRTLAATNRDLTADVNSGRFRDDLYFRLHVVPLHLPPLRERREDVPLLVEHFLARYGGRGALPPPRLSTAALETLGRHSWPGNVRELANIVERIAILHAGSEVGAGDVQRLLTGVPARQLPAYEDERRSLGERLDEFERTLISSAVDAASGNLAEAARRLRTDRANLYRRMRRLEIDR